MADIVAIPLSHASLDAWQQSMVDMLIGAMADVREGNLIGLALVGVCGDGAIQTQWTVNCDLAHSAVAGATLRLATEMVSSEPYTSENDAG